MAVFVICQILRVSDKKSGTAGNLCGVKTQVVSGIHVFIKLPLIPDLVVKRNGGVCLPGEV